MPWHGYHSYYCWCADSDEEIREQLLQSMLHRDNFDSAQAQQSPYWLQSYQGAISQPGQSMPGMLSKAFWRPSGAYIFVISPSFLYIPC